MYKLKLPLCSWTFLVSILPQLFLLLIEILHPLLPKTASIIQDFANLINQHFSSRVMDSFKIFSLCFLLLTSHGRFHSRFYHPHQKLKTLGVLSQSRCKGCQGIGMTSKVLEGNTLSEVCLQRERDSTGVTQMQVSMMSLSTLYQDTKVNRTKTEMVLAQKPNKQLVIKFGFT